MQHKADKTWIIALAVGIGGGIVLLGALAALFVVVRCAKLPA